MTIRKFERLEVWQLAVAYLDTCYAIAEGLPRSERYNLNEQLRRAATSVALNIAEGSTSQTDKEQRRLLGLAIRSLIETVACLRLIERRYEPGRDLLEKADRENEVLFAKLQRFRTVLSGPDGVREAEAEYEVHTDPWKKDEAD